MIKSLVVPAFLLGCLVETTLWGHRAGPGWLVLVLVCLAVSQLVRRRLERPLVGWTLLPWACSLAYAVAQLLYDGKVVHGVGPLLNSAGLLIAVYVTVTAPPRLDALAAGWGAMLNAWPSLIEAGRAVGEVRAEANGRALRSLLAGFLMALPLLGVFCLLFASADPAFGSMLERVVFNWSRVVSPGVRVALFSLAFLGYLRALVWAVPPPVRGISQIDPQPVAVTLTLVNLLFGAFLACQARYLFAGRAPVGLSLANYARLGFFELFAATLLVLGLVVALYARIYDRDDSLPTRVSAALLVLLTFGLAASAIRRMDLYIQSFGLTLTRAYVEATLLGILVTLALTLVALWRRPHPQWLTSRILVTGMLFTAGLGLVNLERVVAATNVARCGDDLDVAYLGQLTADAAPILRQLAATGTPAQRAAAREWLDRQSLALARRAWTEWNLSAAAELRSQPEVSQR